jgi:peptidoglycan/LPS O-acetylase OafA/YrhL
MTKESLLSIQVLRAVAALAVTIVHITSYEFARQLNLPDALPKSAFGSAGVDLFFVISGFIIVYASEPLFDRARGPQEFLLRRIARIVPLYWLTTTIILAYMLIRYRDLAAINFSVEYIIASYFFIPYAQTNGFMAPVHGVGWTLNYEMFFYATFCLALLFTRQVGVMVLAAVMVAFVGINQISPMPNPIGYLADPLILEFVFGMLIALALRTGFRIPRALSAIVLVLAVAAIVASDLVGESIHRVVRWGMPCAAIVAAVALADTAARPGVVLRVLNFLGDASYALYLVHPIAITLPRRLLPNVIDPAASPWLYAALLLIVAVAAASLVHLLFERPITRLLQRRIVLRFRAPAGPPKPVAAE